MIDPTAWAARARPGPRARAPVLTAAQRVAVEAMLLDFADFCHPGGRGHFVCDNLSAHDTDDVLDWLEGHPRWTLHFTPKHASWLNQVECAFSSLGRHVLSRGSFRSLDELRERVHAYMVWFNEQIAPAFRWSYRPKSWGSA